MRRSSPTRSARALACALLGLGASACGGSDVERPNVLWVVLDTVRADHMSLYGYERPTTPFLEEWCQDALVFEDCVSTAGITLAAHGSMFTGLLPSEHGANNDHGYLEEAHTTVAEAFRAGGYRTFLWASNPYISSDHNFAQGFEVERHPWDDHNQGAALEALLAKLDPSDTSSERPEQIRSGELQSWGFHATGSLAQANLTGWLDEGDDEPWFAFLNYMEAHRPYLAPRAERERMMSPEEVELSYAVDRGWETMWEYVFELHDYSPEELAVMEATYDACIAELDGLLRELMGELERRGELEDTIVVITADHGEHLGEHHLLDHQFSVYDELLRVPLVLRFPAAIAPGRDASPVMNFDVHPTLFELADLPLPQGSGGRAMSLLTPAGEAARARLAEYVAHFPAPIKLVRRSHPDFDGAPYERALRAYVETPWKLIWSSDGRHELYDVVADPQELVDRAADEPELLARMLGDLEALLARSTRFVSSGERPRVGRQARERLDAVGYGGE